MLCSKCGEEDPNKFYKSGETRRKRNLCKECTKLCMREKRRFIKTAAVKYLGGECIVCGYSKRVSAMDFHHRDSQEKEDSLAAMIAKHPPWDVLQKELDKCDLMCCRCHRELHNPEDDDGYQFDHSDLLSGIRVRRGQRANSCRVCGAALGRKSSNKCCSDECRFELRTGMKKPTPEELGAIVGSNTRKDAAKHYGVSVKLLRKWMKEFDIPFGRQNLAEKVCPQCLGVFRPKEDGQLLCSHDCHLRYQRRHWPSVDELRNHISVEKSRAAVARIYGVDSNTIKHWASVLGVDTGR